MNSFFQANTLATEILYSKIGDLLNPQKNMILLDICCGTGSIGLCLASRVQRVMGLEMNPNSVQDAKLNAVKNGLMRITPDPLLSLKNMFFFKESPM